MVHLKFPVNSGVNWENIMKVQRIRNTIIHNGGHIDPEKHNEQIRIVSANDSLNEECYARRYLIIEEQYLMEVINDIKVFTEKLSNQNQVLKNAG